MYGKGDKLIIYLLKLALNVLQVRFNDKCFRSITCRHIWSSTLSWTLRTAPFFLITILGEILCFRKEKETLRHCVINIMFVLTANFLRQKGIFKNIRSESVLFVIRLMKQAYLEVALVLNSIAEKLRPPKMPERPQSRSTSSPTRAAEKPSTPKERKISKRGSAREKDRKEKESREKNREFDAQLKNLWAAIRAAGLLSLAQFKVGILTGDPEITALTLSERAARSIPGFALFDLLGTDDVIKISEDGALVAQDGIVTMGTTINKSNRVQVTWLHLLGYLTVLRRQCSYSALGVYSKTEGVTNNIGSSVLPMFSTRRVLKLSVMHSFLKNELARYATECCGLYPPEVLSNYGTTVGGPQMMLPKPSNTEPLNNSLEETGEYLLSELKEMNSSCL